MMSAAVMGWHWPEANSRRACATVAATRLPTTLGESAGQDRHEFGLRIDVKLFGRIQDFGECDRLSHSAYHANMKSVDNSLTTPCQENGPPALAGAGTAGLSGFQE